MKRFFQFFIILTFVLCLSSCVDYIQSISFKNGKYNMYYKITLSKVLFTLNNEDPEELFNDFNEEVFKNLPEGTEIKPVNTELEIGAEIHFSIDPKTNNKTEKSFLPTISGNKCYIPLLSGESEADLNTDSLLFLILNTCTSSDNAKTVNAIVSPIAIFSGTVTPCVDKPKINAASVIKPIIIPWYTILHVIPFVNIPFLFFIGFLFIIPFSAGSTANAKAGNESVTRFIHKICTGNNTSNWFIYSSVIPKWLANIGVNNIAKNKTTISPTLLDNKNAIAFKILL